MFINYSYSLDRKDPNKGYTKIKQFIISRYDE